MQPAVVSATVLGGSMRLWLGIALFPERLAVLPEVPQGAINNSPDLLLHFLGGSPLLREAHQQNWFACRII